MKTGEIRKLTPGDNPTPLKALRINRGITQRQLSALSGLPIQTVRYYETNPDSIHKAQYSRVVALANALKCDPQDLLQD